MNNNKENSNIIWKTMYNQYKLEPIINPRINPGQALQKPSPAVLYLLAEFYVFFSPPYDLPWESNPVHVTFILTCIPHWPNVHNSAPIYIDHIHYIDCFPNDIWIFFIVIRIALMILQY